MSFLQVRTPKNTLSSEESSMCAAGAGFRRGVKTGEGDFGRAPGAGGGWVEIESLFYGEDTTGACLFAEVEEPLGNKKLKIQE